MTALLTAWRDTVRLTSPGADPEQILDTGADLLARWSETHRRYHTTRHLEEVLDALDLLTGELSDIQDAVARLAAWFHDAVYAVHAPAGDNEHRSAQLAADVLRGLDTDPATVATVADLIELTADHEFARSEPLRDAFHDADLWILSAGRHRFDEYCAQVREEFAHVPGEAYARARSAILRPFLERRDLYRTAVARSAWAGTARANLALELRRLGG